MCGQESDANVAPVNLAHCKRGIRKCGVRRCGIRKCRIRESGVRKRGTRECGTRNVAPVNLASGSVALANVAPENVAPVTWPHDGGPREELGSQVRRRGVGGMLCANQRLEPAVTITALRTPPAPRHPPLTFPPLDAAWRTWTQWSRAGRAFPTLRTTWMEEMERHRWRMWNVTEGGRTSRQQVDGSMLTSGRQGNDSILRCQSG